MNARFRSLAATVVAAVVAFTALVAVPTAASAAPSGTLSSLEFVNAADGTPPFTTNPVDDSISNDVVAVNDSVVLYLRGVVPQGAHVVDAEIQLTIPDCWVFDSNVLSALNYTNPAEPESSYSATIAGNTLTATWNQREGSVLQTSNFSVKAGPDCANDSTWTPEIQYTDGSGTHTVAVPTITVKSVAKADLAISAVGSATNYYLNNRNFGGDIGNVAATQQAWEVTVSPETLSRVGYTDPDGNISFDVAFAAEAPLAPNAMRSVFELSRNAGTGVPTNVSNASCWSYVSPGAYGNGNYPSSSLQTLQITMKTSGACAALLTQTNKLHILQVLPTTFIPENCGVMRATVSPTDGWVDAHGTPITETNTANNTATTNLCRAVIADGWNMGASIFTPKVADADYAMAYPWQNTSKPIVRSYGVASAGDMWAGVDGANVGLNAEIVSESIHSADFVNGASSYTNMASYHFWDPAKQQLNKAKLGDAVMGYVAPSIGNASTNAALDTKAFDPSLFTVQCTTDFTGANSAGASTMTWQDCDGLPETQISGVRLLRASSWNAASQNPNTNHLFSQVPFIAVGSAGVTTTTTTRWEADQFTNNRQRAANVNIVGNDLAVGVNAYQPGTDPAVELGQLQLGAAANYVITPQVSQPSGTFLPYDVLDLTVENTIDVGIESVDISQIDPFWSCTLTERVIGPDGVPYTNDVPEQPWKLVCQPAEPITTQTPLPPIAYQAVMGIVMPVAANPTITNSVVISATDSSGSKTANKPLTLGTAQLVSYSKRLISDPEIEVEDEPAAWRLQWANNNNRDLGDGVFVDVFPFNGDSRGATGADHTAFSGSFTLEKVVTWGSAQRGEVHFEMTTASPATIDESPANNVTWVPVDISQTSAEWETALGGAPTAIRVKVDRLDQRANGYGAIDLHFKAEGQKKDDVYHNDATGQVLDSAVSPDPFQLGKAIADPVRVIASSVSGIAWIDQNANGLREDDEPRLADVPVRLFRAGHGPDAFRTATTGPDGSYTFDNLHSSSSILNYALTNHQYQVVFDVPALTAMGYKLTTQLVDAGASSAVDSDADETSGEIAPIGLGRAEDVTGLDAGVLAIGPQATVTADASMDRTYHWSIEKSTTNADSLTVAADGSATIDYEAQITELAATDSNARLTGEVVITNPTDDKTYTVTATVAADGSGLTCTVSNGVDRTLAPRAVLSLDYSCTGLPGDDLDRTLTATVTSVDQDPLGTAIPDLQPTADAAYALDEIDRTVSVEDIATIAGVAAPATDFGPYTWSAAGTTHTENYTQDVTVPAGDCLAVTNTATIVETGQSDTESLTACLPVDLSVSKNVITSMQTSYGWSIAKRLANPDVTLDADGRATLDYEVTVTEGSRQDAASTMSGSVTVTNPNVYKSVEVTLTDTVTGIDGGPACVFAAGPTATLAAGQTRQLDYSCTFASEPTVRDGANTATVTWDSDAPGTDRALTDTGRTATDTVAIAASDWDQTEFQRTVTVSDVATVGGTDRAPREFGPYTWSAEGTQHSESYSIDVEVEPGSCLAIDNTASLVETGARASTQHLLCNEVPLAVSDEASATLTRNYSWAIDKRLENRADIASDRTPASVAPEYSVVVTEGETGDSGHEITGRVLLENRNTFRAYVVGLADTIDIAGVACVLDRTSAVVVPANTGVEVPYRCAGDPGDTLTGTHEVQVTGAGPAALTHQQDVEYGVREVGRTVTVTDDRYDFAPAWTIEWSAPGTEHERAYALTVDTKPGACQTFTNTARLGENGPASSAAFEVCAPAGSQASSGGPGGLLSLTGGTLGALPWIGAALALAGAVLVVLRVKRRRR